MRDQKGPSWTIQDTRGLYTTMHDQTGPQGSKQDLRITLKDEWNDRELKDYSRRYMEMQYQIELYSAILNHEGP